MNEMLRGETRRRKMALTEEGNGKSNFAELQSCSEANFGFTKSSLYIKIGFICMCMYVHCVGVQIFINNKN